MPQINVASIGANNSLDVLFKREECDCLHALSLGTSYEPSGSQTTIVVHTVTSVRALSSMFLSD